MVRLRLRAPNCISLNCRMARAANEAFLASCSAEEKAGLQCLYMGYGDDVLDFLWHHCPETLPDLPS